MSSTTSNRLADSARKAALNARAEYEAREEQNRKRDLANSANAAVELVERVLGITAVPNPDDGTAGADGFTFRAKFSGDYHRDLNVKTSCPRCGDETWRYVSDLAGLGQAIEEDMLFVPYCHQCPSPDDELDTEYKPKPLTLREQVERQVDDFDIKRFDYLIPVAQVEALEEIAKELRSLRLAYEQRNF